MVIGGKPLPPPLLACAGRAVFYGFYQMRREWRDLWGLHFSQGGPNDRKAIMSKSDKRTPADNKLSTPTGLGDNAVKDIEAALNALLADTFALYFKTKNFHWHVSGPHFRDYHLMFDEQAGELISIVDDIAERVRKIGGITLHSVSQVAGMSRIAPNDAKFVEAADMVGELLEDNKGYLASVRAARSLADDHGDAATVSLFDGVIDQAERRVWFLYETLRPSQTGGH